MADHPPPLEVLARLEPRRVDQGEDRQVGAVGRLHVAGRLARRARCRACPPGRGAGWPRSPPPGRRAGRRRSPGWWRAARGPRAGCRGRGRRPGAAARRRRPGGRRAPAPRPTSLGRSAGSVHASTGGSASQLSGRCDSSSTSASTASFSSVARRLARPVARAWTDGPPSASDVRCRPVRASTAAGPLMYAEAPSVNTTWSARPSRGASPPWQGPVTASSSGTTPDSATAWWATRPHAATPSIDRGSTPTEWIRPTAGTPSSPARTSAR